MTLSWQNGVSNIAERGKQSGEGDMPSPQKIIKLLLIACIVLT